MAAVILGTSRAAGLDERTGAMLPRLFVQAGIGTPDGTDVTGHVEPLGAAGGAFMANVYRSLLPVALA